MLNRMVVSNTSMRSFCLAENRPKMVLAGWMARVRLSKRFVARWISFRRSIKSKQASLSSKSIQTIAPAVGPNCLWASS